jgi:hypothetical protein
VIRTQYGTLRETLEIPTGMYCRRVWPVVNPDDPSIQLAIAGWSARCQIRDRPDTSAPVLYEWDTTPGTGVGLITLITGSLSMEITQDITEDWTFRRAWYDVYLTDPAGHPTRLVEGRVIVVPAVTR